MHTHLHYFSLSLSLSLLAISSRYGLTENAGHEIAGHEFARHDKYRMKIDYIILECEFLLNF